MLKVSYAGCFSLSQLVSVQFALEMCLSVKCVKSPNGANREPVYDFLLVMNSNLSLISHC